MRCEIVNYVHLYYGLSWALSRMIRRSEFRSLKKFMLEKNISTRFGFSILASGSQNKYVPFLCISYYWNGRPCTKQKSLNWIVLLLSKWYYTLTMNVHFLCPLCTVRHDILHSEQKIKRECSWLNGYKMNRENIKRMCNKEISELTIYSFFYGCIVYVCIF